MKILLTLGMIGVLAFAADMRIVDAAKNQNWGSVRTLLKQKADANAADSDGSTPLIWAAHWDNLEAVKLLLASGATAKAANRHNVTALAEASNVGNGEMVEALLAAGADANATRGQGETPLMTASRTGSLRAVKALLAKGANVNAVENLRGETPLMWAVAENHADVAKALIAAGADVNAASKVYEFNFRKVASGGTQAIYSKGGLTPLLFAARQGSLEAAEVLIAAGAKLEQAEPDFGFTPLLEALYNDHYDVAALLVEKGANVKDGALYVAVEMRNLDYFGNRPRKPVDGKLDELGFIRLLLDKGADPNQGMKKKLPARMTQGPVNVPPGATPFWRAARSADTVLMRLLIEKGADANKRTDDNTSPLIAAATGQGARFGGGEERPEADFIEALRLCVQQGADVNAVNDRGETALHGAAAKGANQLVQFLADNGAKLDVKNKAGRTPYDVAMGIGGVANTGGEARTSTGALLRKLMEEKNQKAEAR